MNILLCGAQGFIGRHIALALRAQGHRVVSGQSAAHLAQPASVACTMDFSTDLTARHWLPRLKGIDAVVNAVGLLRPSRGRSLHAVHTLAPCALMNACAMVGSPRVIHISALGIEDNDTAYARTKRAADAHALALSGAGRLSVTVVRPSIVFGPGGASSAMFTALARAPLLCLPRPVLRARVQPVAVHELAEAVARLLSPQQPAPAMLHAVGPTALTLADFIASLRQQMGRPAARVLPLPDTLTRWSARLGDTIPASPWCSATLSLLAQDNTADPADFAQVLGRAALAHGALHQATHAWRPRNA